ncbi:helix-turn-helix transcriptional regulator [Pseudenhygromyxa sp. WMMC2535]|uniref:AraC family transcriptional regulator n=1 Tax=Pseudenhygromyxa sp. WMMC2535 TaxID=2712867 RepID=UPI001554B891|nr:AraC family transcriptional regulator [Pseudenhygromyxa sp. WMMC2535]NVB42291.1 helix-turn-helix transcriptional regulator [Pseudenhygromyxa sp. WMMC2535]
MSPSQPRLVTLDDLGARGRPLHVLSLSSLGPEGPDAESVPTCYLILILTRGSGSARHIEAIELEKGDIHLIPAGSRVELLNAGDAAGWLVAFDPAAFQRFEDIPTGDLSDTPSIHHMIPQQSLIARGLLKLRPSPARLERVLELVHTLDRELSEPEWGALSAAQAVLVLLLIELFRHMQAHAPQAPLTASPTVRATLAHIERHCTESLTIDAIASAVKRSPSHLSRLVRKETGLTIGEWLREHRMVEARRRLLGTPASVETIAREVGYADVTHFIRVFRREHGQTPHAWRAGRRRAGRGDPAP